MGGQTHLLGEGLQLLFGVNVLPDPLHVVPVLHDAVLHRVPHRQQAPVLLAAKSGEGSLEKANNKTTKCPGLSKGKLCGIKKQKGKRTPSFISVLISGKKNHSENEKSHDNSTSSYKLRGRQ